MKDNALVAILSFAIASQFGATSCSRPAPRAEFDSQVRESCNEFLAVLENPELRDRLVNWADREVFSRTFSPSDFRIGHLSGPGYKSMTLDVRGGAVRLPDWLPVDSEVRVVNGDNRPETIFIAGGRYKGWVIARNDWETSIDGRRMMEEMIVLREGRVGLVCYLED